ADDHFQRIAARFYKGFPLYQVHLGSYILRVRPRFQEGTLVEIALRFRERASSNEVDPVIYKQLRFGLKTLSARFGKPDKTLLRIPDIDPRDFKDGGRVPTHQWSRGDRSAQLVLWRDGFTYGAEIVLAEKHARVPAQSPADAF
ncbi:MAG TPA: hypothetical protein VKA48_13110, partial [Gammaproteobacteria bacterium]|nr:hypothetical protein [Gammaproteobacteria bacterium]